MQALIVSHTGYSFRVRLTSSSRARQFAIRVRAMSVTRTNCAPVWRTARVRRTLSRRTACRASRMGICALWRLALTACARLP